MNKIAFDLLVAANSDLFRKIMTYDKEWYFSYQYLKNLKKKEGFDLIKTKYEVLAKDYEELNRPEERKRQSVHVSNEKTLRNMEKVKQECIVENLHPDLSSGFSFN